MNHDEIIEQATKVMHVAIAHRWVTVCSALREDRDYPELLRDIARALADAGLLARPLPDRDEIAEVAEAEILTFFDWPGLHPELPLAVADAVLDLLKGQDR